MPPTSTLVIIGAIIVVIIIVLWYVYGGKKENLTAPISGGLVPGQSYINDKYYEACRPGYASNGTDCRGICPANTWDAGISCGRIVAPRPVVPKVCPSTHEYWGGVCYKKCPDGGRRTGPITCDYGAYGGVVTNCGNNYGLKDGDMCPAYGSQYHKTALCTCQKGGQVSAAPYSSPVGLCTQFSRPGSCYTCPSGAVDEAGLCYSPATKVGYKGVGAAFWPNCTGETSEFGAVCSKFMYPRRVVLG